MNCFMIEVIQVPESLILSDNLVPSHSLFPIVLMDITKNKEHSVRKNASRKHGKETSAKLLVSFTSLFAFAFLPTHPLSL